MKHFYRIITLVVACAIILNANAGNNPKFPEGFKAKTSNSINFTENKGQVCDQNYKARPDVLFSGTDGQLTFHLKNNGISYQLNRVDTWKKRGDTEQRKIPSALKDTSLVPDQNTIYRLDINWLNANTKAAIIKGNALEGYNNYYLEQCPNGALNVKSYGNVTYQNIYTGINLKWYQKDGHLKYDYIVAAGADYKHIQLQIKGAEKISINSKGQLVLKTPLGNIIEEAPLVIQAGGILKSKWLIEDNRVSYEIENLNTNEAFVIDPAVRVWGTYYGENNTDIGNSCTVDILGNVFMAGNNGATGGSLATLGAHQTSYAGSIDAFLVKFNSSGVRQWGTYYGSSSADYGLCCATNTLGDVFMAGYTNGGGFPAIATAVAHQTTTGGGSDAFLVKFNSSGVRQWATMYGGTNTDIGRSCATDLAGNVYLAGNTFSSTGSSTTIATIGAHQPTIGSAVGADAFLVKFNSSGVRLWATYYGGDGVDVGYSCATNTLGDVYLSGTTTSTSTPSSVIATAASHQSIIGGGNDAFLVKFDASGVRQWGTYYGGSSTDLSYSCITDVFGNVFMSGVTSGSSGTSIATAASHQTLIGGGNDAFLVKFNSFGVRQWGTYYGDAGNEEGHSCSTNASGDVYLSGRSSSSTTTMIATVGSYQSFYGGGIDAFLAKFTSSGIRDWGSYYGTALTEIGNFCATDNLGNIYMAGQTDSHGTILATLGSHQPSHGTGTSDAFLVKFNDCTSPPSPTNITAPASQTMCALVPTTLLASGSGTISWFAGPSSTVALSSGTAFTTPTLSAGNYTYYTEAFTCANSVSRTAVTLTVSAPTISATSGTVCLGGTFTIVPSGALSYTYSGGSAFVSPTTNTFYNVTGTSAQGCVSPSAAVSNVTIVPLPTVSVNSGAICTGNTFTIIPSGAITYTYSGGSATVSPATNTSYSVTGTSSVGCISSNTAICAVTVYSLPLITVNNGTICSGNTFTIIPAGAISYSYSSGVSTVTPGITTSYVVTGISTQGCLNTATSNIVVNISPTISVNSGTLCAGDAFTMSPTGAFSYNYSSGSAIVSPLTNTLYFVTGSSAQGCVGTNTAIATVTVYTTPALSVNSGSICSGSSFTMNPTGAANYTFSSGNAVVAPLATSAYTVSSSNTQGCTGTAVSNVTVVPLPQINITNSRTVICIGESNVISAIGATSYTWSNGSNNNSITINPTTNSTYSVTGVAANGCTNSAINSQSVDVCAGLEDLSSNIQNLSFHIYPNPTNGEFTIDTPSETNITIINALGQVIKQQHLSEGKNTIDFNEQAKGIYFVKTNRVNYKIIKN